jgi:hypothetical protein
MPYDLNRSKCLRPISDKSGKEARKKEPDSRLRGNGGNLEETNEAGKAGASGSFTRSEGLVSDGNGS